MLNEIQRTETMTDISKLKIATYKTNRHWDFGNKILYDLCSINFHHDQDDIILTKVLFIGRIYAAAIERRKNKSTDINDDFYTNTVAPTFRNSNLDKHLADLKGKKLTVDIIPQVLQVHYDLMKTLFKITELNKRSFCSKYLHFHLPDLFFIYDSRALTALRDFKSEVPKDLQEILQLKNVDSEYANFYCRSFDIKNKIEFEHKTEITPRQLDNLLIEKANGKKQTASQQ